MLALRAEKYLGCGIFAHGFARARCHDCGHDYFIAFIHHFGSSINEHVHFHVCVVDGVFEEVPGQGDADTDVQSSPPGIVLHPASAIDETAVA